METFSLLSLLLLPLFTLSLYLLSPLLRSNHRCRRLNLPPQPRALPFIGNLAQLGALPHRSLRRLSETYGPILYLKLGRIPAIVVSSPETAREVMKTQDLAFCTRPSLCSLKSLYNGGLGIAFCTYGPYWRQARRICASELFSSSRIDSLRRTREEEVAALVGTIRRLSIAGGDGSAVDLSSMSICLMSNITCRAVFGRRFGEVGECRRSPFHDLIVDWPTLQGTFTARELFRWGGWLDVVSGLRGRFYRNFKQMDALLDGVIDEYEREEEKGIETDGRDHFMGALLRMRNDPTVEIPLRREGIKAHLMDIFLGGTDTVGVTLDWGMSELMRNPEVMKKAQGEIRAVVGAKGKVEESDLHHLHYLNLVVKEILRMHPAGSFAIPRESVTECQINGYDIPAKTRVFVNLWAIAMDPNLWEEPEEFRPERFDGNSVDYKGQHFHFLPFGSGRRVCPGFNLAIVELMLTLANLLHVFDWRMPGGMKGEELDMEEVFGLVTRRKSPLLLVAIPRIHGDE